jgi:hypothetical protein
MSTALHQRIVTFYGDELVAVQQTDGTILVLFSRLCENLGLERTSQTRRIQRHAVMSKGLMALDIQTPGGIQSLQCLKLSLLPLWLSGVQVSRVKSELQEQLTRYQEEASDVLWQAFKPQIVDEQLPANRESALAIGQLEQIIEQSKAMQRMAEEHPDKTVVSLDPLICPCSTMFRVDGPHLAWSLEALARGELVNQIVVDDRTARWARVALQRMLDPPGAPTAAAKVD